MDIKTGVKLHKVDLLTSSTSNKDINALVQAVQPHVLHHEKWI